jgi:hypothetical protein
MVTVQRRSARTAAACMPDDQHTTCVIDRVSPVDTDPRATYIG